MTRSVAVPCSTVASLFKGRYPRVGRDLSVDVSYISRAARGERRSEFAEEAIDPEFNKVLAFMRNGSAGLARTEVRSRAA